MRALEWCVVPIETLVQLLKGAPEFARNAAEAYERGWDAALESLWADDVRSHWSLIVKDAKVHIPITRLAVEVLEDSIGDELERAYRKGWNIARRAVLLADGASVESSPEHASSETPSERKPSKAQPQRLPPPSAPAVPVAAQKGAKGSRLGRNEEERAASSPQVASEVKRRASADEWFQARANAHWADELLEEDWDALDDDIDRDLERMGADAGARHCAAMRGLL